MSKPASAQNARKRRPSSAAPAGDDWSISALRLGLARRHSGIKHFEIVAQRDEEILSLTPAQATREARVVVVERVRDDKMWPAVIVGPLFTIRWATNGTSTDSPPTAASAPSTEAIETEITAATGDGVRSNPAPPAATPIPAPPATEEADTDPELAAFETPRLVAELERRGFRRLPAKRARANAPAEPRRSKNAELDAAAARGIVPVKPDVTSHANHHYQSASTVWPNSPLPAIGTRSERVGGPASIATRRWCGSIAIVYWPLTTLQRPRFEDCARRRFGRSFGRRRRASPAGRRSFASAAPRHRHKISLAWLLQRSSAMLPIPGTSSIAHLEENLASASIRLTSDEFRTLASR
jgi:hypothetical protein